MPRISPVDHDSASGSAKELLNGVKAQLGVVPNIFATFVQSPKVLEGFLAFNAALGQGVLSAQLREQIALTVAGLNGCDYCASAHTALGKGAGIDREELGRRFGRHRASPSCISGSQRQAPITVAPRKSR